MLENRSQDLVPQGNPYSLGKPRFQFSNIQAVLEEFAHVANPLWSSSPSIKGHLLKPVDQDEETDIWKECPLSSSFHPACPLLTLVFICLVSCFILFFSSLHLSLPMALANTSQGLQSILGDDRSAGLWNCTGGAHASRRHRSRPHPRLQVRPGCRLLPCAGASGACARLPTL